LIQKNRVHKSIYEQRQTKEDTDDWMYIQKTKKWNWEEHGNWPFGSGIALLFLGQLDGNAELLGSANLLLNIGERSIVSGFGWRRSLGFGSLSGDKDWIWYCGV